MAHRSKAFAYIDLIVAIVLVGVLVALWAPVVARSHERELQTRCYYNLATIGQSLSQYLAANSNHYPGTGFDGNNARIDVSSSGAEKPNPFAAGAVPVNCVPASLFVLLRATDLNARHFICPAGQLEPDPTGGVDPENRSNFTDVQKNLGYSYLNPSMVGVNVYSGRGIVVMADLNPGVKESGDVGQVVRVNRRERTTHPGNSNNHAKLGQNVLFSDNHVEWVTTPYVGHQEDNIYTTWRNTIVDWPVDRNDTILLPAQSDGAR